MTDLELKPCPFCGQPPLHGTSLSPHAVWCGNMECGVIVVTRSGWPDAVKAWNERAADTDVEQRLRAAEARLSGGERG